MITVVPATEEHIPVLAERIRAHERTSGDIAEIMRTGLRVSRVTRTGLFKGEPGCMWGVHSETVFGENHMWLVTTDLVDQYPLAFLRQSRRLAVELYDAYGILHGFVHCDFAKSHLWMQWLGFRPIGRFNEIVKYELRYGR